MAKTDKTTNTVTAKLTNGVPPVLLPLLRKLIAEGPITETDGPIALVREVLNLGHDMFQLRITLEGIEDRREEAKRKAVAMRDEIGAAILQLLTPGEVQYGLLEADFNALEVSLTRPE